MKNLLVSGDLKQKIQWYIKAHGHSSIGGLNLIWTQFNYSKRKYAADIVDKAIKLFENFTDSDDLAKQLKDLNTSISDVEEVIKAEELAKEKRTEMTEILDSVRKNVTRIEKIIKNPGYEEKFELSKILFSSAIQLLKHYPNTLYGDLIGEKGANIGDRIKIHVNTQKEISLLCCGYEIQLLFFNLMSNAIESIKDKGNIFIEIRHQDNAVQISVSDDGKLIQEAYIAKITDHKEFSTKGTARGHGLNIINDIVERYKGNIKVKNDPAKHLVTFLITIPIIS